EQNEHFVSAHQDSYSVSEMSYAGVVSESTEPVRRAGTPLAVRMRPRELSELVGQQHLLRPGSPLVNLANPDGTRGGISVILWGPPGTGKTTLAQIVARSSGRKFVELSAVTAGVKDVRT